MNGYVIAGYVVVFSVLFAYCTWMLLRERTLVRRRSPRGRR